MGRRIQIKTRAWGDRLVWWRQRPRCGRWERDDAQWGAGRRIFCRGIRRGIRRGVTLVELLVAVTILVILAAFGFSVVSGVRESAKRTATVTVVTKVSDVVTEKYESYANRKLPITSDQIDQLAVQSEFWTAYWPTLPEAPTIQDAVPRLQTIFQNYGSLSAVCIQQYIIDGGGSEQDLVNLNTVLGKMRALTRLVVLRDLIRLEMPERVADLWVMNDDGTRTATRRMPVWNVYGVSMVTTPEMEYLWAVTNVENLNPAELLYLIVSRANPDAVSLFHESEVADVGMSPEGAVVENGLKEFVDSWGMPIVFYRSAPGYSMSLIQASAATSDGSSWAAMLDGKRTPILLSDGATVDSGTFGELVDFLHSKDPDPLDLAGVDPYSWRTVPIVVSAGPDGQFGMFADKVEAWKNRTFWLQTADQGGVQTMFGSPMISQNGKFVHSTNDVLDNVTNHQLAEDQ